VSPFRRSTVIAWVESDRVVLVKAAADVAAAAETRRLHGIDLACGDPAASAETLQAMLAAPGWRGLRREVLVSDRLVHYAAMERPRGVRSVRELELAAEGRLEQLFDINGPDWIVRVDARPFSAHVLACALPRGLVERIRGVLCAGPARVPIRPYLLRDLARHASRLPKACWFASAARDYIGIVHVRDGCCHRIRIHPTQHPDARLAVALVERERTLLGEAQASETTLLSGLAGAHDGADVVRLDEPGRGKRPSARTARFGRALAEAWA
jgi:hypothetical protein